MLGLMPRFGEGPRIRGGVVLPARCGLTRSIGRLHRSLVLRCWARAVGAVVALYLECCWWWWW